VLYTHCGGIRDIALSIKEVVGLDLLEVAGIDQKPRKFNYYQRFSIEVF
jgi:hypothetical protein